MSSIAASARPPLRLTDRLPVFIPEPVLFLQPAVHIQSERAVVVGKLALSTSDYLARAWPCQVLRDLQGRCAQKVSHAYGW